MTIENSDGIVPSPVKVLTSGHKDSFNSQFHVIPDVHGNYLTLIQECFLCIESFRWNGKKELMTKYVEASHAAADRLKNMFEISGYSQCYLTDLRQNNQKVYNTVDGNEFIEELKMDLNKFSLETNDQDKEIIFAGDLLADRQTNSLYMLYTFAALKRIGLNFKIIFSNHDELFFQVFAQLKQVFHGLDKEKLKNFDYIQENFIKNLRRIVSSKINTKGIPYTKCYASLLQFALTLEKQIYELHQENQVQDSNGKISLVSGFAEVIDIIETVYIPNLKMAHIEDLKTTEGKRPFVTTHAPQAMIDQNEAGALVTNLYNQVHVIDDYKKILNILLIYSPYQLPFAEEIMYLQSMCDYLENVNDENILFLKAFILNSKPMLRESLNNHTNVIIESEKLLKDKIAWFIVQAFNLPQFFINFKESYDQLDPNEVDLYDSEMIKATNALYSISDHFINTKQQVFHYRETKKSILEPLQHGYIDNFFQLCQDLRHLQFSINNIANLTNEGQQSMISSIWNLYQYLSENDRANRFVWDGRYYPNLDRSMKDLKNMYSQLSSIDMSDTNWYENPTLNKVYNYFYQNQMFVPNKHDQNIIHILKNNIKSNMNHHLYINRVVIFEIAQRVLVSKFSKHVAPYLEISDQKVTSIWGLWRHMVTDAYQKSVDANMDEEVVNQLFLMYRNILSYRIIIEQLLLSINKESINAISYVDITKKMIENMDYIIQTFPSIIYDRDESQVMTDLQKSIYDFVWNRKEVRGDQSGQSLIVNLHGHTGNADTEEDDNRITIASLDNQESKIKNVRIRLEASKAEEQEPYAIAKEPTKLKCTPNLFNKKQKRNETDNVIAEKKPKINSVNNMTSNH